MWTGSAPLMRVVWPPVSVCASCHVTTVENPKWIIIITVYMQEYLQGYFQGIFRSICRSMWKIIWRSFFRSICRPQHVTWDVRNWNDYRRSELWVSAVHTQWLHQVDREERGEGKLLWSEGKLLWYYLGAKVQEENFWIWSAIIPSPWDQCHSHRGRNRKFERIHRLRKWRALQWYASLRWLVLLLLWWAEARLLEHQLQVISPVLTLLFWFLLFQIYSMWYF